MAQEHRDKEFTELHSFGPIPSVAASVEISSVKDVLPENVPVDVVDTGFLRKSASAANVEP